jgi:uncharacterized protein YndB with AHSA1/START domain
MARHASGSRRRAHIKTIERDPREGQSRFRALLVIGGAAILVASVVMVRRRSRTAPPRPGQLGESVEIARSPEEVFAFVADPQNDARWTPQIEGVRKTSSEESPGLGSTFEVVVGLLGRRFELSGEITEYDAPNRTLSLRTSSGPLRIEAVRTVEAIPGGARFTITAEMRTGGFFWLLPDPLFGVLLRRQGEQTLDNLKALLEAQG